MFGLNQSVTYIHSAGKGEKARCVQESVGPTRGFIFSLGFDISLPPEMNYEIWRIFHLFDPEFDDLFFYPNAASAMLHFILRLFAIHDIL